MIEQILLTRDECYCTLPQLYMNVAKRMGKPFKEGHTYDCTKICVSKAVQNETFNFYNLEQGYSEPDVAMLIVQYGPKASIASQELYIVEVERWFIKEE